MTITYRDASPKDGALLGGLARAIFIETFGPHDTLDDLTAFLAGGSDAAYAAELADPGFAVRLALAAGTPIGFCKVGPLQLPAPGAAAGAVQLYQLYVFRPWQGEGVAATLTDWAIDTARARSAPEIWLSVFTENPRARRFYVREGFEEIAPYTFAVGSQADEDIMCRRVL